MLPLVIIFVAFLPVLEASCHGSRVSYRSQFMGELTLDNHVLLGHVFANYSVQNFTECSRLCKDDCRCRSFNLPMSGQGQCGLNDADNSTVLMAPLRGTRYHHLQKVEFLPGDAATCWQPYSNGCCASNPCENGAQCTEVGDHGKNGFTCACLHGYLGQRCERRIRSCFDRLWDDKARPSGYYTIWNDQGAAFKVYCNMLPEKLEAWTLVMSYEQSESAVLKDKPLFVDHALNELDVTSGNYRLSLDKMQDILKGMEQEGRELEWKATCDFSFVTKTLTSDDVVRSRFSTLDIMKTTPYGDKQLVGYYPFSSETAHKDRSGLGNHGSFYGISYEDGPLGDTQGSVRMTGSTSSYIRLHDNSGKLDTRHSQTIMVQVFPYVSQNAPLVVWANAVYPGIYLWQWGTSVFYQTFDKAGSSIGHIVTPGFGINTWNYIAVTYDHKNLQQTVYLNGTRLDQLSVSRRELGTIFPLTLGRNLKGSDVRAYNGRMACLKFFSGALTEEEIEQQTKNWECPKDPELQCVRVDYINIRGKECYGCEVMATQRSTETFTIHAYSGDQSNGCNFKSGSTLPNEKLFGVYDVKDSSTHACAASSNASTQYWFGGRL